MLYLVTPLIEGSDDIDYIQVVEANTPEQALDYFLSSNSNIVSGMSIAVTQPKVHNAVMHKCNKSVVLKENIYVA